MPSTDAEILAPAESKPSTSRVSRLLALLLDNSIRIPGTNIRFGIDPILGLLFPGAGDAVGAMAGSSILVEAARKGAPTVLIGKMGTNILINSLIGGLPGIGDAFSFWFKSNARNYGLLQEYLGKDDRGPAKLNLVPVILFFALLIVALAINIWLFVFLAQWLGGLLSGTFNS